VPTNCALSPPNWLAGTARRLPGEPERQLPDVSRAKANGQRLPTANRLSAFLNVPYDDAFQHLYLAYIAGLAAKGLAPRAALEIPGGLRRLDRILDLTATCRYSFHDLSRVEVDTRRPATPRFNMAFELGLVVAWERSHPEGHYLWFVFESKERSVLKSLSDLAGTDVYAHGGTVKGVFRQLRNALVRTESQPSVQDMHFVYARLRKALPSLLKRTGSRTVFEANVFKELVMLATELSNERMRPNPIA
jgi:hypothetical protein